MIRRLVLRHFKRFDEVEFRLPGHVVLASPNNTGKTTVLQAVAAWGLALTRWRQVIGTGKPQRRVLGSGPRLGMARPMVPGPLEPGSGLGGLTS